MPVRRPTVAAVAACLALSAAAPAADAPNALTPSGPATVGAIWLGPVPAVLYGPRVVLAWTVDVGAGGEGGAVALRVLRSADDGGVRAVGTGTTVELPATPGSYRFEEALPFGPADFLGLDQQTGGHAIVHEYAPGDSLYEDTATDVWRPLLEDGQTRTAAERLQGRRLLLRAELESDVDRDRRGDQTQDVNDIAVSARSRRAGDHVRVTLILRNRGARRIDRPALELRFGRAARVLAFHGRHGAVRCRHGFSPPAPRSRCRPRAPGEVERLVFAPLPPGAGRRLTLDLAATGRMTSLRLLAVSEGRDPRRGDRRATLRLPVG